MKMVCQMSARKQSLISANMEWKQSRASMSNVIATKLFTLKSIQWCCRYYLLQMQTLPLVKQLLCSLSFNVFNLNWSIQMQKWINPKRFFQPRFEIQARSREVVNSACATITKIYFVSEKSLQRLFAGLQLF